MYIFLIFLIFPFILFAEVQVAITVDDLPVHGKLPSHMTRLSVASKMLSVLKKYKIPEVYGFVNGGKIDFQKQNQDILKLWTQAGYPLGNHTFSHIDLNQFSVAEFEEDILLNEKTLKEASDSFDWKYFRYPYLREGDNLEKRNAIRHFLNDKKYKIAQVTLDFEDWAWNGPYARCSDKKDKKAIEKLKKTFLKSADLNLQQSQKIANYLFNRPIKHILLLHIGAFDAEVLEDLIKLYLKRGVKFAPLSVVLEDNIYSIDPGQVGKWGSEIQIQILKSKDKKLSDIGIENSSNPIVDLEKICL